ncbi:hypothetical protein As57867_021789, partial [Aphanomyces stellatus]
MYNGIGLRTTRGSGTNGYVQKNLSYVKPAHIRERERQAQLKYALIEEPHKKNPVNKQILLHEQKRQVEVKVMELRDELEEQGCDDEEIEEKCAVLRKKLQERTTDSRREDDSKHASSHAKAIRKEKELAALKDAFGIRDSYVEGNSFDVDLQEQRRLERMEAYDKKHREREERERERDERSRPRLADKPAKEPKKEKRRRRRRSPSSSSSSSSSSDSSSDSSSSSSSSDDEGDRRKKSTSKSRKDTPKKKTKTTTRASASPRKPRHLSPSDKRRSPSSPPPSTDRKRKDRFSPDPRDREQGPKRVHRSQT